MNYKTDFTEQDKNNAVFNLIKNYKSRFYESKCENTLNLIKDSNICIYCKINHDNKISIQSNLLQIGYFCSELCKLIYYSLIKNIFNFVDIYIINFVPYYILDEASQNEYQNIKIKLSNIDYKKIKNILSTILDNEIIIMNIKLIDTDLNTIDLEYILKYKKYSNTCFYCNDDIDNSIILYTKYCGNIIGFCSTICRDSISKQIYNILIPKFKYKTYLIPFEIIYDKDKIKNIIKLLKCESILYGGHISSNNNNSKIEFFVPK